MSRVNQPVLALLPARARSVGPSAGLLEGPDGGVVFVFGLATFSYASADAAGRRLAAVQLVTTNIASVAEVASAFGVNEATLWRWKRAFGVGGVVGLVTERPGPRRPSKLTTSLAGRIVKLDATGLTLQHIAAATGVSTATVRVALGRVTPRDQVPVEPDVAVDEPNDCESAEAADLVVLAPPAPRTTDRVAARFGDLAEAPVVITEGAQLPLAGLMLALPGLEMTGLLPVAGAVFPPMRKGFYGLRATLLMGAFLALLREPRAQGAIRIAGPATEETWVGDADGVPVMVITAAPSQSLAAELARLLPDLRALIGPDRACTVVFDRGGYSPAVFTTIIAAGFDVLTYFKGSWARTAPEAFTTVDYQSPDGTAHTYDLAERLIVLPVPAQTAGGQGAKPASTLRLRLIVRRSPGGHQTPILTNRTDLSGAQAVSYTHLRAH